MKSLAIKAIKRIEKETLEQQVLLNKLYRIKKETTGHAQFNIKNSSPVIKSKGVNYEEYLNDLLGLKKK